MNSSTIAYIQYIAQFGGYYLELEKAYPTVGLQAWKHYYYFEDKYMCQGPYHKDWGAGTNDVHPSISGHRLRAGLLMAIIHNLFS